MAEDKNGFLLYADYIDTIKMLSEKKQGKLLMTILKYVNDENPVVEDLEVKLVWEPIKKQLKRDLVKYEEIRSKKSEAGKKGMKNRWNNTEERITKDNSVISVITKITDSVNDSVNDNVSVSVIQPPEILFPIEECLLIALRDERWVEANKATRKDLEKFNNVLEGRGQYTKNPADYKNHYYNWVAGGRKEEKITTKEEQDAQKGIEIARRAQMSKVS